MKKRAKVRVKVPLMKESEVTLSHEEMGELIKKTEEHMLEMHMEEIEEWKEWGVQGVAKFIFHFAGHLYLFVMHGQFHQPIIIRERDLLGTSCAFLLYEDHIFDPRIPWTREEMIEAAMGGRNG